MENSYILAKILGLFMVIVYTAALFSGKWYKKILADMMKDGGLMYVTGIFTVILWLVMVVIHNIWARDRTLLITIFGWMSLAKGAALIAMPAQPIKAGEYFIKNNSLFTGLLVAMILVGLFLIAKGFMFI